MDEDTQMPELKLTEDHFNEEEIPLLLELFIEKDPRYKKKEEIGPII